MKTFYPTGTKTPAPPVCPARSHSLYRLSYPGSLLKQLPMGHLLHCNSFPFYFIAIRFCAVDKYENLQEEEIKGTSPNKTVLEAAREVFLKAISLRNPYSKYVVKFITLQKF
jgi:hypothetical protein